MKGLILVKNHLNVLFVEYNLVLNLFFLLTKQLLLVRNYINVMFVEKKLLKNLIFELISELKLETLLVYYLWKRA